MRTVQIPICRPADRLIWHLFHWEWFKVSINTAPNRLNGESNSGTHEPALIGAVGQSYCEGCCEILVNAGYTSAVEKNNNNKKTSTGIWNFRGNTVSHLGLVTTSLLRRWICLSLMSYWHSECLCRCVVSAFWLWLLPVQIDSKCKCNMQAHNLRR